MVSIIFSSSEATGLTLRFVFLSTNSMAERSIGSDMARVNVLDCLSAEMGKTLNFSATSCGRIDMASGELGALATSKNGIL